MRCLNCGKNVDISYGKLECPYCGYILDSEENKLSNFNADIKDNKGKKALKKGVIAAGSAVAGIGSIYALNELAKTTKSVPEKDNFNVNSTLGKDSTINSLKDNIADILNKNINESENNDEIDNVTQNDTLNNENNLNKQDDINIKNVSSKSKKSNNKNNQSNKKDSTNLEKNPNLNNESNEDLDNNNNNSNNSNKDSNTNNENPNSNNSNNESENNEENNNVQNDNELEDSSDENVSSDEQEEGFENLTPQQVSQPSTISSGGGNSSQYYADKYKNATEEMVIDPFCLTHSIAVLGGGRSSYESLSTSVINLKNALNNATNVNISFNISGLESKVNESIGSGGTGGKVDEFLGKLRNVRNMEEEKFGGAEEYLKLVKSSEYYLEYLEYDKQQKLNDAFTAIKFENPNSQKYKDAKK